MMGILGLPPGTEIYCHTIPIVLIISGVWSATRHDSWNDIFHHTWRFGWTAFVFMGAIMGLIILTPLLPWFVFPTLLVLYILWNLAVWTRHVTRTAMDEIESEDRPDHSAFS